MSLSGDAALQPLQAIRRKAEISLFQRLQINAHRNEPSNDSASCLRILTNATLGSPAVSRGNGTTGRPGFDVAGGTIEKLHCLPWSGELTNVFAGPGMKPYGSGLIKLGG